jgi:outer membrane receptor protein involved in Fe transport
LTPLQFSPRGSLNYMPVPDQVFRISGGTSFRNPTLLENNVYVNLVSPNPNQSPQFPFSTLTVQQIGNKTLSPEKIESVEIAHNGVFGALKTTLTGFHYRINDMIGTSALVPLPQLPPVLQRQFINTGDIKAWGGEAAVEYRWSPWLSSFANYSYQYLRDDPGPQLVSQQSPRHKANMGMCVKAQGWTGTVAADWVDKTMWSPLTAATAAGQLAPVNAYWLMNAHVGYAFKGSWEGLEAGVNIFNLLNHDHFETLPPPGVLQPGEGGEIIRQRITATLSYRFR